MKVAVFSSNRLGDGLLMMMVAYHYHLAGHEVTFYHNTMHQLKEWFPTSIHFASYSSISDLRDTLLQHDLVIAEYHYDDFTRSLELFRKENKEFPLHFLYFYQHVRRMLQILPGDILIDRKRSVVDGLTEAISILLPHIRVTKENGLRSFFAGYRKNLKRIAVHPTSSMLIKNWTKEQFYELACILQKKGYEVVFCLGKSELNQWELPDNRFERKTFDTLSELATFICESGYFIGNDSGLGHLASNLRIPTVVIFSRRRMSVFWRPNWFSGEVVLPAIGFPNLKFLRLRDKFWQKLVSVKKVLSVFENLEKKFS